MWTVFFLCVLDSSVWCWHCVLWSTLWPNAIHLSISHKLTAAPSLSDFLSQTKARPGISSIYKRKRKRKKNLFPCILWVLIIWFKWIYLSDDLDILYISHLLSPNFLFRDGIMLFSEKIILAFSLRNSSTALWTPSEHGFYSSSYP